MIPVIMSAIRLAIIELFEPVLFAITVSKITLQKISIEMAHTLISWHSPKFPGICPITLSPQLQQGFSTFL